MICTDYQTKVAPIDSQSRSARSVSIDIDRLLSPKSSKELDALETQISAKLKSNEPIDVEFWDQLRSSIAVYKAKAVLNDVYKSIVDSRLVNLRQQQVSEATAVKEKLALLLTGSNPLPKVASSRSVLDNVATSSKLLVSYSPQLDPETLLKLRSEDKVYDIVEEADFVNKIVSLKCLRKASAHSDKENDRLSKGVEFSKWGMSLHDNHNLTDHPNYLS